MTVHYHGTPITPRSKLLELAGRNFCVSFAARRDVDICHEIGQSVMLDNGAYTFWRRGDGDVDMGAYAEWVLPWLEYKTTWCVIPDKIDGTEQENDLLLEDWFRLVGYTGMNQAPVWHLHESIGRLKRLMRRYPRVCIGSSGEFAEIGDRRWHQRMHRTMNAIAYPSGVVRCWLHMLRGMALAGSEYPFSSVDSVGVGRNHAGNNQGRPPFDIAKRAAWHDARQCPARWHHSGEWLALSEEAA